MCSFIFKDYNLKSYAQSNCRAAHASLQVGLTWNAFCANFLLADKLMHRIASLANASSRATSIDDICLRKRKLFMMTTGSKSNSKITNIPFRVDALHNNRSFDHTIGGRQVLLVFFAVVQQEISKYFAQQRLIGVTVYL